MNYKIFINFEWNENVEKKDSATKIQFYLLLFCFQRSISYASLNSIIELSELDTSCVPHKRILHITNIFILVFNHNIGKIKYTWIYMISIYNWKQIKFLGIKMFIFALNSIKSNCRIHINLDCNCHSYHLCCDIEFLTRMYIVVVLAKKIRHWIQKKRN